MIGPWPGFEPGQTGWLGPGPAGRLFLRPPTLTAGNFAALWPTDPKFLALKDLNPFKTVSKVQKTSSILRVGFALSKWPHLHRAYVVGGCLFNFGTVVTVINHNTLIFLIDTYTVLKYKILQSFNDKLIRASHLNFGSIVAQTTDCYQLYNCSTSLIVTCLKTRFQCQFAWKIW